MSRSADDWIKGLSSGWIFWPVCLAGVAMVSLGVLGPEAARRVGVEDQVLAVQAEVATLKQTSERLAAAEKALTDDPTYTERIVRHELGLVRPGEIRLPQRVKVEAPAVTVADPDSSLPVSIRILALFGDVKMRFLTMVFGATLIVTGILFSLPGRAVDPAEKCGA